MSTDTPGKSPDPFRAAAEKAALNLCIEYDDSEPYIDRADAKAEILKAFAPLAAEHARMAEALRWRDASIDPAPQPAGKTLAEKIRETEIKKPRLPYYMGRATFEDGVQMMRAAAYDLARLAEAEPAPVRGESVNLEDEGMRAACNRDWESAFNVARAEVSRLTAALADAKEESSDRLETIQRVEKEFYRVVSELAAKDAEVQISVADERENCARTVEMLSAYSPTLVLVEMFAKAIRGRAAQPTPQGKVNP